MEISYDNEALLTRIIMLSDTNDILFIVEDFNKENHYEMIVDSILNYNNCFLNYDVLAMNGKNNVIKAYNLYNDKFFFDKLIFIVDLDFDLINRPNDMIENERFIYLDKYNIESFLFTEKNVLQYVQTITNHRKTKIKKMINYKKWESEVNSNFYELFVFFAYINRYHDTIKGVGDKPYKYIDHENGKLRIEYLNSKKEEMISKDSDYQNRMLQVDSEARALELNIDGRLICGKYKFKSLCSLIKHKFNVKFNHDNFQRFLLLHIDVKSIMNLSTRIIELTKNDLKYIRGKIG